MTLSGGVFAEMKDVPLRLAVTAAFVYGFTVWADATVDTPKNSNVVWLNELVNYYLLPSVFDGLSHELRMYFRNLIAGTAVYHSFAGLWSIYIYLIRGKDYFTARGMKFPDRTTIFNQILVAQTSIFSYVLLPIFASFCAERGYSRSYYYISEVGWPLYFLYSAIYLLCVEVMIYWTHRWLHTVKPLYSHIHLLHHKYNKPDEMSPYASVAFHPVDGMLQALPYVVMTFVVPMHYITSLVLFLNTSLWATLIHDGVEGKTEPLMGAGYHTIHHTHYMYNFGQFFVFCDKFWGTLRVPKAKK